MNKKSHEKYVFLSATAHKLYTYFTYRLMKLASSLRNSTMLLCLNHWLKRCLPKTLRQEKVLTVWELLPLQYSHLFLSANSSSAVQKSLHMSVSQNLFTSLSSWVTDLQPPSVKHDLTVATQWAWGHLVLKISVSLTE